MLDVLYDRDGGKRPEMIVTDTASYSDIVFGVGGQPEIPRYGQLDSPPAVSLCSEAAASDVPGVSGVVRVGDATGAKRDRRGVRQAGSDLRRQCHASVAGA
ncbi:hypothetical protein IPZ58_36230 [Streptomyces roseoverticillatus]|nr:hypothetical protein [Streptomyces roseoverticillatus]